MLLEYFTKGTQATITGANVGCEIETDFVDCATGEPIDGATSRRMLAYAVSRPWFCEHKLELGRQKIELAIRPAGTFSELLERAYTALDWLYTVGARHRARPIFKPVIEWEGALLDESTDTRDQVWVALDGRPALEELCRCSSIQFTVDVNPNEAISVINALWSAGLHKVDYAGNDARWQSYIAGSRANYAPDRYGGPEGFEDIRDYVARLLRHQVVMHQGRPVQATMGQLQKVDIDLFLRSVWWHYRLRRYEDSLAVEIRPRARRQDNRIAPYAKEVSAILGLWPLCGSSPSSNSRIPNH